MNSSSVEGVRMLKRTALFEEHQRLSGRLIDFGGWELPVQYSGVMDEHLTCRAHVGIFDVSHMGEIHVQGSDSESFLNYLVTQNVSKLSIGQAQYTLMCHDSGGIVDDLVIYKRAPDSYLLVVNASNIEKDFQHIIQVKDQISSKYPQLTITNESQNFSQIAIQGRNSASLLSKLTSLSFHNLRTYWFIETTLLSGIPALIGRTGYTGEDGFEIYLPWEKGPELWRALLEVGSSLGIKPCGLGARDTLRLEMKYPLYGHELTNQTNPFEAGLEWVVKLSKPDFVGRNSLIQVRSNGIQRSLVGFKMNSHGIPRQGYSIWDSEMKTQIGEVTSGTQSPSLREAIGIGYIRSTDIKEGSKIFVRIRNSLIPAEIVSTPFYKRPY